MKKNGKIWFCLIMMLMATTANAQDYNKMLWNVIKAQFKKDLKGYQFLENPTDNYGLITTYEGNTDNKNFVCDMYDCLNVTNPPASKDPSWLTMNGFAAGGDDGKTITLNQDVNDKVGINLILPKILSIVGLNANYDKNNVTHLDLTMGPVYIRQLRKERMSDYLDKLKMSDPTSDRIKLFNSGQMVLIVGDCVVQSMTVDFTVADTTKAGIDAKFNWSGSTVAAKILDSASVGVNFAKQGKGHYKFTLTHPVIFARLAKKQSKAGELGKNKDEFFEDWAAVDADIIVIPDKTSKQ